MDKTLPENTAAKNKKIVLLLIGAAAVVAIAVSGGYLGYKHYADSNKSETESTVDTRVINSNQTVKAMDTASLVYSANQPLNYEFSADNSIAEIRSINVDDNNHYCIEYSFQNISSDDLKYSDLYSIIVSSISGSSVKANNKIVHTKGESDDESQVIPSGETVLVKAYADADNLGDDATVIISDGNSSTLIINSFKESDLYVD